jgi:hypothetical protein
MCRLGTIVGGVLALTGLHWSTEMSLNSAHYIIMPARVQEHGVQRSEVQWSGVQ